MIIETWFPTPIFYVDVTTETKNEIYSEYCLAKSKIVNLLQKQTWGDNINTTNPENNLLKDFNLTKLEELIYFLSKQFCNGLKADNLELTVVHSWINYANKYQYQNKHDHLPHFMSGVYYLETNGLDGNLTIHAPNQVMESMQNTIEYQPKDGRIILFPSWVQHSVRANMTDSVRTSVSFNLDLKK